LVVGEVIGIPIVKHDEMRIAKDEVEAASSPPPPPPPSSSSPPPAESLGREEE
jgi:hypothetical protein